MNKREFVAGGMVAVVAAPSLAQSADAVAERAPLRGLLTRTQRLPDLAVAPSAGAFEAHAGERIAIAGENKALALQQVSRIAG